MTSHRSLILGTAGHIDHGKSSLIMALTGIDPDRLAEEKRRGITIELGFAQLSLPSGRSMGVVDVPGHERFVRQMVSGATGIDVALLAIAADDGIMPQTIEHMAVLELLGVSSCVIALTKADMVDEEWLEFMRDDVAARLESTPFANAPIVAVSSHTKQGLDELQEALDAAAANAERTKEEGKARLPIDRVFTVKGFGTVVTGTLWSGTVRVGDEMELLPSKRSTRIRSIQIHGESRDEAKAGNRVALNLDGLGTDDVRPGDFLAFPATQQATDRFDARLRYLNPLGTGKALETGTRVHVAHGTKEVIGRVLLANGQERLEPGADALAQIRLEEPLPVALRDRFIIRSYSPVRVIGGGVVLAAHPRRRTNLATDEIALLESLEAGNDQVAFESRLALASQPDTLQELIASTGLSPRVAKLCWERALEEGKAQLVGQAGTYAARPSLVQKHASAIERELLSFHSKNPDKTGIAKEALRQVIAPSMDKARFDALLQEAEQRGVAVQSSGEVSHPKASAGAHMAEKNAADAIYAALVEADVAPPALSSIAKDKGIKEALARKAAAALVEEGRAVRIDADLYYAAAAIARHKQTIAQIISEQGPATAATLKDAMGVSRKFAMPLLEYFDSIGFTRREGDVRSLV